MTASTIVRGRTIADREIVIRFVEHLREEGRSSFKNDSLEEFGVDSEG